MEIKIWRNVLDGIVYGIKIWREIINGIDQGKRESVNQMEKNYHLNQTMENEKYLQPNIPLN